MFYFIKNEKTSNIVNIILIFELLGVKGQDGTLGFEQPGEPKAPSKTGSKAGSIVNGQPGGNNVTFDPIVEVRQPGSKRPSMASAAAAPNAEPASKRPSLVPPAADGPRGQCFVCIV